MHTYLAKLVLRAVSSYNVRRTERTHRTSASENLQNLFCWHSAFFLSRFVFGSANIAVDQVCWIRLKIPSDFSFVRSFAGVCTVQWFGNATAIMHTAHRPPCVKWRQRLCKFCGIGKCEKNCHFLVHISHLPRTAFFMVVTCLPLTI